MEDEDMVSPLVCAWDFVVPRESKKQIGNDSASLYLHVLYKKDVTTIENN